MASAKQRAKWQRVCGKERGRKPQLYQIRRDFALRLRSKMNVTNYIYI